MPCPYTSSPYRPPVLPHPARAVRADPVAEFGVGVIPHVRLDLLPGPLVAPDALAIRADGKDPVKHFDLRDRFLQLAKQRPLGFLRFPPLGDVVRRSEHPQ